MNTINSLSRRVAMMHGRLSELYQNVNTSPSPSPDLLPVALKELGVVSEELQVAIDELRRQNERLVSAQNQVEQERQRYQTLFESVSDACLVTDANSVIQEANQAMADLVNVQTASLIGKSLVNLIPLEEQPVLQAKLALLAQNQQVEFSVRLQRHSSELVNVALTVQSVQNQADESVFLLWMLRDITERKRAEAALENPDYNLCQDRPYYHYSKGEMIPLETQSIWLVSEGVVKLTTLSDRGEEMLVGLIGETMVFGSNLTTLQTYQAIALSDVKLSLISLTEVAQSSRLAQLLLPSVIRRLQQTENLLAIYEQIRVEDRLNRLLRLLKQAIGQPVEQGTRLRARLTHQDFAGACCTTRVTITRLLGKLQQQGKVILDAHNHLVLKD
ncbi:PAS domain S-box protein [Pantanalinema sp. GBBB05]|uniref:PAS domain S-box protein n=1 Tax=Pantanalinema sp. GBBB05 TaxID=2604139 RepID=UPI001D5E40FD|nr:PAS domain S-box protein [Pantanalinema sp. GBBB05]